MPDPPQLNPAALSLADLARVLTLAGGQRIDVAMLEADLADGAPTNADGTLPIGKVHVPCAGPKVYSPLTSALAITSPEAG